MVEVSVVVPTYQESETIAGVVEAVRDNLAVDHEVIVVDDSPDPATYAVVDELPSRPGSWVSIWKRWPQHQSTDLSSAVLQGFDVAEGDRYVVLDGDGQHPPRKVSNLLLRLEGGADVAIASRHADGGGVDDDWPLHRRVVSTGAAALSKAAVPQARPLTDPMSGFFAVRADVVDPVRAQLRPHGYKVLLELLARCPVEDVQEVPYTFQKRAGGGSNLGPREYVRFALHLGRLVVPSRRSSSVAIVQEPAEGR